MWTNVIEQLKKEKEMCTQVSKLNKINIFDSFFKGIIKWSLLILKLLIVVVKITMTMGPIQFQWLDICNEASESS